MMQYYLMTYPPNLHLLFIRVQFLYDLRGHKQHSHFCGWWLASSVDRRCRQVIQRSGNQWVQKMWWLWVVKIRQDKRQWSEGGILELMILTGQAASVSSTPGCELAAGGWGALRVSSLEMSRLEGRDSAAGRAEEQEDLNIYRVEYRWRKRKLQASTSAYSISFS